MGGQNGVIFTRFDIQRAIQSATARHSRRNYAQGRGGRQYPTVYYYNRQNWALFAMSPNVVSRNFIEYPLLQGDTYRGGPQGPDRVIIETATGEFAGVLTHRGVANNGFRPCFGSNQPPVPTVAPFVVPVINAANNPLLQGYPRFGSNPPPLNNTTAKERDIIEIRDRVVEIQA